MAFKLGSLFDGSGGFPLAGALCGVKPCWASEVEPYPIAVTRSRFPHMRHLGDISKINGAEIEPVDIITFGSPCQDLSVAGKRAGLKHEANGDDETTRSGLFMEAVRIIKEMREATNGEYPRYALWENVPGAFSSNKGEDFRIVCEELIKIVEPDAFMPEVPKNGWNYADSYVGDGWSLAYRVFDAQYWGVPQRRRRIHLVADFRGQSAREVLFERQGVRGYFAEGRTPWEAATLDAQGSTGADDSTGESSGDGGGLAAVTLSPVASTLRAGAGAPKHEQDFVGRLVLEPTAFAQNQRDELRLLGDKAGALQAQPGMKQQTFIVDSIGGQAERGWEGDTAPTLKATHYKSPPCVTVPSAGFCTEPSAKARGVGFQEECAPTLRAGVTPAVVVYDGAGITSPVNASNPQPGDPCHTLSTDSRNYVVEPLLFENHSQDTRYKGPLDVAPTVSATFGMGGNNQPFIAEPVVCLQGNGIDRADTAGCNGKGWKEDTCYTLNTIDRPAVVYGLDRASFNQGENAKYNFEISDSGVNSTLVAKGPSAVAYGVGNGQANQGVTEEKAGALNCMHDQQAVLLTTPQYIVRRLTPTECARLQGFADRWGDIATKDSFTDEEYRFWLEVRNTHAAINGKATKDYTPKQMLTWYNKLQTDSAEYKMWGNGIALPPALYCMQGITDALNTEEDDSWLS